MVKYKGIMEDDYCQGFVSTSGFDILIKSASIRKKKGEEELHSPISYSESAAFAKQ